MKKSIQKVLSAGALFIFLSAIGYLPQALSASMEDTKFDGASAGVIDAKINETSKQGLLLGTGPKEVGIKREEVAPKKSEGPSFFVQNIILEGDLIIPESQYLPLVQQYENRKITFDDLQTLINGLEQIFRAKGYIAVVLLPPQKMEKPQIKLNVVVSKMGQVRVEGNRYFRGKPIRAFWTSKPGQILRYDKIRADVLNMNENPDRTVKPILRAGAQRGATDVILNVEDRFPIHAGFTFDNQGVKLTGKDRPGFSVRHNNFLGLDDTLLVGTVFGTRFGAMYVHHLLPLGTHGTKLVSTFSHAQVNPKKEFKEFHINGISDTYSLAVQQRLFRTDRYASNVQVGFDFKDKRTKILSQTTAWDRERVLSFRHDIQGRDRMGGWSIGQGLFLGMSPRGNGYPLASRGGAHNFFKYTFSLARVQKMPKNTKAIITVDGQVTANRLLPQEQMFLGGARSVRGYPESDYGADRAIQTRVEYWVPSYFFPADWKTPYDQAPLREQFQILGFLDDAYGWVVDPTSSESHYRHLLGTGIGLDWKFSKYFSARWEWGFALGGHPITEHGKHQMHFSIRADY